MEKLLLEDCCEILDSMRVPITSSNRVEGPYPYYGANGIQDHVADYIFDDELVLLAEDGGNFGSKERPIAYRVSGKCWVNNHAHVLKPKEGLDVDYLCYSLMFYNVGGMVNGATRQKLTQAAMRQMLIPKRTMEEQKYIVDLLAKVVAVKEKRQQELTELDNLIKARFVELFGNPVINEKGWNTSPLNDVCDGIGDGLHGTPEYDTDGDYPFINGNNLMDGSIEITPATKMVNERTYKKHYIEITDNAILLSINGTLGKLAFYRGEEVMLGKSACYCNLKPEINREFVYGVMKTEAFSGFLESNSTASTIKNVGLKAIRGFNLILPPDNLQNEYVEFAKQVDKSKVVELKLKIIIEGVIVMEKNEMILNGKGDVTNEDTYKTVRGYVVSAQKQVSAAVNSAMVIAYWNIGKQIYEACGENERAEYGKQLLKYLAEKLTKEFGKGFSERNLQLMRQFYLSFQNTNALRSELSWTHYRSLMRVEDKDARDFYLEEAVKCGWSSRQLERQINSFYYQRILASKDKKSVSEEINELEPKPEYEKIIKDPYVLEFLDLPANEHFYETELEQALIDHLQKFLLELGRGYSFVARQKHFNVEGRHFYIDLVFYNYILKCFVLIDLKIGDLTHQDLGQMQMYVNYYTRQMMNEGDNPPIGIVLCADKSDTLVEYTLPEDNNQIFAAKYLPYMPTKDELKRELNIEEFEKKEID